MYLHSYAHRKQKSWLRPCIYTHTYACICICIYKEKERGVFIPSTKKHVLKLIVYKKPKQRFLKNLKYNGLSKLDQPSVAYMERLLKK